MSKNVIQKRVDRSDSISFALRFVPSSELGPPEVAVSVLSNTKLEIWKTRPDDFIEQPTKISLHAYKHMDVQICSLRLTKL